MKTATYTGMDGKPFSIQYDETAPCRICGYSVMDASMGGTDVCPWCDMGKERPDKTRTELQPNDNPYHNAIEANEGL